MEIKVGDTVEVIDSSGHFQAKLGDKGTVVDIAKDHSVPKETMVRIETTDGRYYEMFIGRFKKITEEAKKTMEFKVGQEVLWDDHSYCYELVNGKLESSMGHFINRGEDKDIYVITELGSKLPANSLYPFSKVTNDTIIIEPKTNRVFFTQQRFLKEAPKPEPKFKRGDLVIYGAGYYRISFGKVENGNMVYGITQNQYDFGIRIGQVAYEHQLKDVL